MAAEELPGLKNYPLELDSGNPEKSFPGLEQEERERWKSLAGATLVISSALDLDSALQGISEAARKFGRAKYAALGIVDENGLITSFITNGITKEEREKIGEPPRGHGLLGVLIRQGQPIRVKDMSKDPRGSGFPPHHPPMTSLLGVPVSLKGRVVGDLYLTDKIGSNEFSEEDEWWLTLFARQAAVALENANLYRAARLSQQRFQILAELAGALNGFAEIEPLFNQITRASCRLLETSAAALYLLDEDHSRFVLKSQVGLYTGALNEPSLPLRGSMAGQVLFKAETVTVQDTSKLDETFFLPLQSGAFPLALMVVPIKLKGQVNGVIEVYSTVTRRFNPEEISLLEAFSGYAALALEKAQLFKEREEFLSVTAHDLRAPLASIKLSAGLLEANLPKELPIVLTRLASNISRNSERVNNLLSDLLELTRLESGMVALRFERLEVSEVVGATINTLTPLFEEKNQKLDFNKPHQELWFKGDRRRVERALVNILSNANKYTPAGGLIRIEIVPQGQWVTIQIEDNGPGIPYEERERIFERFYRRALQEDEGTGENGGTGLGLAITRRLVVLHGGKIWVEGEVGSGSVFKLRLPLLEN